jgi:hypothetical protein
VEQDAVLPTAASPDPRRSSPMTQAAQPAAGHERSRTKLSPFNELKRYETDSTTRNALGGTALESRSSAQRIPPAPSSPAFGGA